MARFLLTRIAWTVFVLFGSSLVVFLIIRVVPGDPARAMLGQLATPEAVAALQEELGLDESLAEQYYIWLTRALHGDLGQSFHWTEDVLSLVIRRLEVTVILSLYALVFALVIALGGSIISATRRRGYAGLLPRMIALVGLAMPSFWIGLMLMLVFSLYLGVLPVFGYVSPLADPGAHLSHIILPAVSLGAGYAALIFEMNRAGLIEVLEQDYIRTARAGGLSERRVVLKYGLRNALIPTVTVIGIQIGYLMSGAMLVESVFAIPGMGRLLVEAVLARDYTVVQAGMLVTVFVFVIVNLGVDVLYGIIDPRVSRARRA